MSMDLDLLLSRFYAASLFDSLQLKEVYVLLNENYVEDDDNMFRFDYSSEFLRWALQPPGNFQISSYMNGRNLFLVFANRMAPGVALWCKSNEDKETSRIYKCHTGNSQARFFSV